MVGGDTDRQETDERRLHRRAVLAGLGLSAAVALAGCPGDDEQIEQSQSDADTEVSDSQHGSLDTETVTGTARPPPEYRDFVPAALDEIPAITYTTPGDFTDTVSHRIQNELASEMGYLGLRFERFEYVASIGNTNVAQGLIDQSAVGRSIYNTSYDHVGEYGALDLYDRTDDRDRTLAIGDETVIVADDQWDEAREAIEDIVDVKRGTATGLHETNETFDLITDRVGSASAGWLLPLAGFALEPEPELWAKSFRFGQETVSSVDTYLFQPAVTEADLDPWIEELRRNLQARVAEGRDSLFDRSAGEFGVTVEQQADVTIVVFARQLDRENSDSAQTTFPQVTSSETPLITWGIRDEGDRITVTHEAGEPIDAERLTVLSDGNDPERDSTDQQFSDEFERVEPGDQLLLDSEGSQNLERISNLVVTAELSSGNRYRMLIYHRD